MYKRVYKPVLGCLVVLDNIGGYVRLCKAMPERDGQCETGV